MKTTRKKLMKIQLLKEELASEWMNQDKSTSSKQIVTPGLALTVPTTTLSLCQSTIVSVRRISIQTTALFTCLTVAVKLATSRRTSSACIQTATWSAILAHEFLERNSWRSPVTVEKQNAKSFAKSELRSNITAAKTSVGRLWSVSTTFERKLAMMAPAHPAKKKKH